MGKQGLSRREFLYGILLGLAVAGCGGPRGSLPLILALKQGIPASLVNEFRRRTQVPFRLQLLDERAQLLAYLRQSVQPPEPAWWDPGRWFRWQPSAAALSLLGADALDRAIAAGWLDPLPPDLLGERWQHLDPRWQAAARREGQIWGVPWRWGVTAIAYRRDRVSNPIRDWADLWRPELAGKLTLPDHPREVIGLVLKKLGRSYNDPLDPEEAELRRELGSLHRQVLAYTSADYLPMLRLADSWVAVGWSQDLYVTQANYPELEVVIPASGSAIWWDVWVRPHRAHNASPELEGSLLADWIDFVLTPEFVPRLVNLSGIASVLPLDWAQLPPRLRRRADFQPSTWERGEIWRPLSSAEAESYLRLWDQMRRGLL
ncbi:extracellular solute-binding protein [Synechococcus sp. B60.1]|uniref:extracellular solute-binding protein n=1 Tax=unclassified Synechococcus TaxID=2626047 RepID=UPI0039C24ABE